MYVYIYIYIYTYIHIQITIRITITTSIFCKIPFKHNCSSSVGCLMNRLIHLRVELILMSILPHCKASFFILLCGTGIVLSFLVVFYREWSTFLFFSKPANLRLQYIQCVCFKSNFNLRAGSVLIKLFWKTVKPNFAD